MRQLGSRGPRMRLTVDAFVPSPPLDDMDEETVSPIGRRRPGGTDLGSGETLSSLSRVSLNPHNPAIAPKR